MKPNYCPSCKDQVSLNPYKTGYRCNHCECPLIVPSARQVLNLTIRDLFREEHPLAAIVLVIGYPIFWVIAWGIKFYYIKKV